jgi:3-dehydroquinate dehydratase/shikimate dehydrogenase
MEELKMNCHSGSKVIVSCYVNGMTPSEEYLSYLVANMQATRADIIKLVINATNITEITRIFHLLSHCQVSIVMKNYLHSTSILVTENKGYTSYTNIKK